MKSITFLGRIHPQKGLIYLLKAFASLPEKYGEYQLDIYGSLNDYAYELEKQFPSRRIIWHGRANGGKEVAMAFKSAEINVLPSVFEGQPLVLWEALAAERPLITSNIHCFSPAYTQDSVLRFKSRNSKDLMEKLIYAIEHKEEMLEKAKKGYAIAKKYDWDNIAEMTKNIYLTEQTEQENLEGTFVLHNPHNEINR